MNTPLKKIIAMIPCYNEEEGIGKVITSFPYKRLAEHGYALEVIVIDNNSKDKTGEVARAAGATVIVEKKQGKGHAIRTGFHAIPSDAHYVVMLDGDNTYRSCEILRLVELLDSGFATVVLGSRLSGHISRGSMNYTNRVGNQIFTFLTRVLYKANVTDVLTGYFAWKHDAVKRLRPHLISTGFAIEMEMVTKMARLGEQIYCVPISYDKRDGESSLRPVYDGSRILAMCLRNFFWDKERATLREALQATRMTTYDRV
jgi:glycosyltransferase involved in cell wall biosynthesis